MALQTALSAVYLKDKLFSATEINVCCRTETFLLTEKESQSFLCRIEKITWKQNKK